MKYKSSFSHHIWTEAQWQKWNNSKRGPWMTDISAVHRLVLQYILISALILGASSQRFFSPPVGFDNKGSEGPRGSPLSDCCCHQITRMPLWQLNLKGMGQHIGTIANSRQQQQTKPSGDCVYDRFKAKKRSKHYMGSMDFMKKQKRKWFLIWKVTITTFLKRRKPQI